jgi:Flp pilus assembly protein TadG
MRPFGDHHGGRRALSLLGDERGAALLEFALVGSCFLALLFGSLQIALIFFAQQSLETAAEATSRQVMTGQVQHANMTTSQFKTLACNNLPTFFKCANLMIDVRTTPAFANASTLMPTLTYDAHGNPTNTWTYDVGGAGSIVVMRLMYVWPVLPGPLNFNLANQGSSKRMLMATSVFKSEPYL